MDTVAKSQKFKSKKQLYLEQLTAHRQERATWIPSWRELGENILPRQGRFLTTDRNKGDRRNTKIINSKPTQVCRTLSAGLMSSVTSPARPWFRLTSADQKLRELGSVKEHFHQVEEQIRGALNKSNIYNCLHSVYDDLGPFGISALHVDEDPKSVIRGYVFPVGSYCLALGADLTVDTCYRETSLTVKQLVEKFTKEKCSVSVQLAFDRGELTKWIDVVHVIEPNPDYVPGTIGPRGMPFLSCWFETSSPTNNATAYGNPEQLLKESGYYEQALMTPRWQVTGEDTYGSSPGMEAIGDCKALQLLESGGMQAFDKVTNPPMRAPSSMIGQRATLLPADITYVANNAGGQTYEPAMTIPPAALTAFREKIVEHEMRIEKAFHADLWLTMQRIDAGKMTATEVSARQQEQMLLLGPVMERLQGELLIPLINRVYGILLRAGLLPDPPEELQGQEIKIEFISIMAQAQKLLGITNLDRLATFVGHISAPKPETLDKIDWDQMVDEYSDALAVPPSVVRPDDQVAAIRAQRQQQQAAAQQAEQAMAMAQNAKTLSETDTGGRNALTEMLGHLGPPGGAQGVH